MWRSTPRVVILVMEVRGQVFAMGGAGGGSRCSMGGTTVTFSRGMIPGHVKSAVQSTRIRCGRWIYPTTRIILTLIRYRRTSVSSGVCVPSKTRRIPHGLTAVFSSGFNLFSGIPTICGLTCTFHLRESKEPRQGRGEAAKLGCPRSAVGTPWADDGR